MALYAVLSGLKPQIASFVAQKQPKELLEAARLAEITTGRNSDDTPMITKLAEMQEETKNLSSRLEKKQPFLP